MITKPPPKFHEPRDILGYAAWAVLLLVRPVSGVVHAA